MLTVDILPLTIFSQPFFESGFSGVFSHLIEQIDCNLASFVCARQHALSPADTKAIHFVKSTLDAIGQIDFQAWQKLFRSERDIDGVIKLASETVCN